MSKNKKRSIWAIVAGVLAVIVVTTLVDALLHLAGFFPAGNKPIDNSQALVATLYRAIIGIAAAYLTARLAPDRPLRHAMILGYFGAVLGLIGVIATWNLGLGPRWYPVALFLLAVPQSWLGGKLCD